MAKKDNNKNKSLNKRFLRQQRALSRMEDNLRDPEFLPTNTFFTDLENLKKNMK
jgi:hypothetical protein